MAPTNTAAWQVAARTTPLEVKSAPYTSPTDNEIVIKNSAVAINPVDWALQARGPDFFPWITYPCILGGDCAGTVVEVGPNVTRFKVGDRVLGHACGFTTNNAPGAAFQHYVVLMTNMAAKIPDRMSFEEASVLPLCFSTAASGLFQKEYLALQLPSTPPKPTGQSLLIWGGATSVGSNAVQLAVAAGYEVITTSSPKNFAFVTSIGASKVFDYASPTIFSELIHAFKGKKIAGAFNVTGISGGAGGGAIKACCDVLLAVNGGGFVASAMRYEGPLPEGIKNKMIFGSDIKKNEISEAVYGNFLEEALENGTFKAAPEALVVGKGLESVQEAFEVQKRGVSARKVVVSLE